MDPSVWSLYHTYPRVLEALMMYNFSFVAVWMLCPCLLYLIFFCLVKIIGNSFHWLFFWFIEFSSPTFLFLFKIPVFCQSFSSMVLIFGDNPSSDFFISLFVSGKYTHPFEEVIFFFPSKWLISSCILPILVFLSSVVEEVWSFGRVVLPCFFLLPGFYAVTYSSVVWLLLPFYREVFSLRSLLAWSQFSAPPREEKTSCYNRNNMKPIKILKYI